MMNQDLFPVISKVETFAPDKAGIHGLVGLPDNKDGDEGHFHNLTKLLNSSDSTEDWSKQLFRDISEETKQKLREIYKYDFEMFDYDPYLY